MNSQINAKSRECLRAISDHECLLHANFTSRNRVHPKMFRTERAISNAPLLTKIAAYVWMLSSGYERSNDLHHYKYGLIELTNFYQINHDFSYFSTKTYHVTGSILNWWVVRLPVLHILTRAAVSSFYARNWNIRVN